MVAAGLVGAGLPDDFQSEKGYKPFVAYSQSKLANLLYSGVVSAVAGVSPVSPPTPRLCTNEPDCEWPGTGSTMSLLDKILGPFLSHSTAAAAQPALFAATSPKVSLRAVIMVRRTSLQ